VLWRRRRSGHGRDDGCSVKHPRRRSARLIGMTEVLLDTELTTDQRDFAETVKTSGEALLSIINDILDFSKIEAGKMDLEAYSFDLRLVLEEVAEMMAARAEEKGLDLIVRYPIGCPQFFIGDGDRIKQVVTNLVGNAVKFTSAGHILLEAECAEGKDGGAEVKVSVSDTGIGIAPDKINLLFKQFSQADSSTNRPGSPRRFSEASGWIREVTSSPLVRALSANNLNAPSTTPRTLRSKVSKFSLPASILEKSRMSLITFINAWPLS
jgi:signal transduction histidine kinase